MLLHLANSSHRPKKGIVKNSAFSFWLILSEILLLKWILKDPMTPASVTMYFWSGCQVETLWCEPHHELTRIFKLPLVLSEWVLEVPCLVWFYVHWIPFTVDCSARKCCCFLPLLCLPSVSSRVNRRQCRGITAQLIPLFHLSLFRVCRGGSGKEHLEKAAVKSC